MFWKYGTVQKFGNDYNKLKPVWVSSFHLPNLQKYISKDQRTVQYS
jgi:hypothetical protein